MGPGLVPLARFACERRRNDVGDYLASDLITPGRSKQYSDHVRPGAPAGLRG
jgi:hypothetical protein